MPNRLLKESICESEEIDQLTWFEEVLFYRLIVRCDDYGRFDGRSKIIKAMCFPLKDVTQQQISHALNRLSTVGLVRLYENDGRPFLQLATWNMHQQIRAKKSKYPSPDITCNQMISDDIKCSRNPIQSESNPNPNPKEIFPGEENPFRPNIDDVREYIAVKNYHFSAEDFMDYYDSVGWRQHGEPIRNWMKKCSVFERNQKMWGKDKKTAGKTEIPMPDYIRDQVKEPQSIDFDSLPGGGDAK